MLLTLPVPVNCAINPLFENNTLLLTCNYLTGCDTGLIAVQTPVTNSTSYNIA